MPTVKCWPLALSKIAAVASASILLEQLSRPRNLEQRTSITEARRQTRMRQNSFFLLSALVVFVASSLAAAPQNTPAAGAAPVAPGGQRAAAAPPPPMILTSTDISDRKPIGTKYTCVAGAYAVSPALQCMQAPRGTANCAACVHDMAPSPRMGVVDSFHSMV